MSVTKRAEDENIKLVTFGCRLNTYESEVMRSLAGDAGLGKTIIVNTCAVTSEAERQARQSIRKLKRENPDFDIIVTGCSAQINPTQYADMKEVERVIGNDEKLKVESYLDKHSRIQVNDIMSVKETATHLVSGFDGKVRAFVQIQNGCNHRCTFCTIPFGRGNSRSVPLSEIAKQIHVLLENGFKEFAITGVDITDYGKDLPASPTLGQTLRRLFNLVPNLTRLRLSSLDPVEVDDDLFELIQSEPRLLPHFHISLQAGDDMILKRMKRRHLRNDVVEFCKKVKNLRPDAVFGADIIAGFPTETEEMFQNTLNLVEECDLTYLHVFPYSPRPGTPAARMPQVVKDVRKERASRLRDAGEKQFEKYLKSLLGSTDDVLIEEHAKDDPKVFLGKTKGFAPIRINHPNLEIGQIAHVKISGLDSKTLLGECMENMSKANAS